MLALPKFRIASPRSRSTWGWDLHVVRTGSLGGSCISQLDGPVDLKHRIAILEILWHFLWWMTVLSCVFVILLGSCNSASKTHLVAIVIADPVGTFKTDLKINHAKKSWRVSQAHDSRLQLKDWIIYVGRWGVQLQWLSDFSSNFLQKVVIKTDSWRMVQSMPVL